MTDSEQDPYAALGVEHDASQEEISAAYRRLARHHHPDTNPEAASGAFSGLTDAYDLLRDQDRRREFDQIHRTRAKAARRAASSTTRIPVRQLRNRDDHTVLHPEPLRIDLEFEAAALGTTVSVPVDDSTRCAACGGTGTELTECPDCQSGTVVRQSSGITIRTPCPFCDGTGHLATGNCHHCDGTGTQHRQRELTSRIPPGIRDGTKLRIPDPVTGTHIDATVHVEPHPYFSLDGHDLRLTLPITIPEATLGATISIPTLDRAITIRIPPGTSHGRKLRVRGRGIPSDHDTGDLIVTIAIEIPQELNDQQRQALTALAAATPPPRDRFERGP